MKTSIIATLICFTGQLFPQQPLDTIFANEQMNVALFFPKPIRQAITGNEHFVFTYNREAPQYFGLLQAGPGNDSNLLVITEEGTVYSYMLKYAEQLETINYFIDKEASIGNEMSLVINPEISHDKLSSSLKMEATYKGYCDYLLSLKHEVVSVKRKKGMVLKLLKVDYHQDEAYFVMQIKNRSGIDFEADDLDISVVQSTKKRKASFQRLEQEILYRSDMPQQIKNRQTSNVIYVLPKFVIGGNEKLEFALKELKGRRKLELMVKSL